MPHALKASGQLIPPGQPFTTTQLKVLTEEDAAHYGAPVGAVIECELSHAANALELFEPADLDRYQIAEVADDEAPSPARHQRSKAH